MTIGNGSEAVSAIQVLSVADEWHAEFHLKDCSGGVLRTHLCLSSTSFLLYRVARKGDIMEQSLQAVYSAQRKKFWKTVLLEGSAPAVSKEVVQNKRNLKTFHANGHETETLFSREDSSSAICAESAFRCGQRDR